MFTGNLVSDLMATAERITGRTLPRSQDDFDNLCAAKTALADKMAEQIHDYGRESIEAKNLWHKADLLQEECLKND